MISYLLSLSLILNPLIPNEIPPNWLYMGAKVKPIQAIKVEPGFKVSFYGALLTVDDWVRVKSAFEGSADLCVFAIDEAVKECVKGSEKKLDVALNREVDIRQTLKAYELRLAKTEEELIQEQLRSKLFLYSTIGLGAISIATITTLFVWSR